MKIGINKWPSTLRFEIEGTFSSIEEKKQWTAERAKALCEQTGYIPELDFDREDAFPVILGQEFARTRVRRR